MCSGFLLLKDATISSIHCTALNYHYKGEGKNTELHIKKKKCNVSLTA